MLGQEKTEPQHLTLLGQRVTGCSDSLAIIKMDYL